jgi:hypothetical protein
MPNFILFLHETADGIRPDAPDEYMAMFKAYAGWADRMRAEGRYKGGEKLTDEPGKVMRPKAGRVAVTDGPYAESKELVGGFFVIAAKDYDEACTVAETCPHLGYGGRIEVRQIHEIHGS